MTVTYADWRQQRMCGRKVRHGDIYAARLAVLRHWRDGGWAEAYRCPLCAGWHVTTRREAS